MLFTCMFCQSGNFFMRRLVAVFQLLRFQFVTFSIKKYEENKWRIIGNTHDHKNYPGEWGNSSELPTFGCVLVTTGCVIIWISWWPGIFLSNFNSFLCSHFIESLFLQIQYLLRKLIPLIVSPVFLSHTHKPNLQPNLPPIIMRTNRLSPIRTGLQSLETWRYTTAPAYWFCCCLGFCCVVHHNFPIFPLLYSVEPISHYVEADGQQFIFRRVRSINLFLRLPH